MLKTEVSMMKIPRRHELTAEQFSQIEHILPVRKGHVGVTAQDNHQFLNAVFWILKTGAPWRDLPERYGDWKNIHRRFSRWAKGGVFDKILQTLNDQQQPEIQQAGLLMLDSSAVRVHQHAAGAKKRSIGIGRFRPVSWRLDK